MSQHSIERDASSEANPPVLDSDAPDTGRPLLRGAKVRFGLGFFLISVLWSIGLAAVAAILLPQRLKDIGVPNPDALLGSINATTALVSLVSNLIFGNLSDRTHSRFGRRTPWIIAGGLLGGLSLFAVGVATHAGVLTFVYCLSMVGLNMMLAPAVAVLSDRIPEAIRGTMSTFWGVGVTVGYPLGGIIGAAFITSGAAALSGFTLGGVLMGIAGVAAVVAWPRERASIAGGEGASSLSDLLRSFVPPTRGAGDFWKAFVGRFTMLVSYQMINAYQLYIVQDHLRADDQSLSTAAIAGTVALTNTILLVVGLIGGFVSGPISDLIGRRKLPVILASLLFAIGVAMPWMIPTPLGMYLFAGIAGMGYAVYQSVDQALNVDVLPSKKHAGKDLGILNMSTTLGQMSGPILTSAIVSTTGSYTLAFPVSILFAVVGCVAILMIRKVR